LGDAKPNLLPFLRALPSFLGCYVADIALASRRNVNGLSAAGHRLIGDKPSASRRYRKQSAMGINLDFVRMLESY
jgi:hypothetical protein